MSTREGTRTAALVVGMAGVLALAVVWAQDPGVEARVDQVF